MSQLITFLDEHLIQALGWTFVHTLWQGCVIVLVMIYALQRIPHQHAIKRYTVATASMLSMLIAAIATFSFLYFQPGQAETAMAASEPTIRVVSDSTSWSFTGWLNENLTAMVAIWAIGVALLSLRLIVGMAFIYRLKQTSSDLTYSLGAKAAQIANSLKYSRAVIIAESALVKIPVVVGYLKPVILFPVGAVNQLSADEVEAVLAHEIAHLVRNDFIHNLIQSVIEIIFYYHPAVWWISAVVRSERENCCDDLAIQVCGNSFTYARALVRLQEVGSRSPALALPFSGSKNHLLERVKRILNQPQNKSNLMEKITATSLLLLCLILASFSDGAKEIERERIDVQKIVTHYNAYFDQHASAHDTIIPRSIQTIEYEDASGETIKVQIENGEVESLRVDGVEIPRERYPEYEERLAELRSNASQLPPPPPAPMAPHAFPMPPTPPSAPAPMVVPMPPLPAGAPLPPAPPAPPAFPDFGSFDYEIEIDPGTFEFNSDDFEFQQDMDVIVEIAPDAHTPHGDVTRSKSIIIREKNSDGSVSYRVEGDNSTIEIDEGAGVAIINGEDVLIDSDSIIVIEETETVHPRHNYAFFTPSPAPDVKWDADKWAREWKSNWNQEEWEQYWKENGKQWVEYGKQVEQSMKEFKESPAWKQYLEEVEEYRDQLENSNEGLLFLHEDGSKEEFIIRKMEGDKHLLELNEEDLKQRQREVEVRVREAREKKQETGKEGENGHSRVLDKPVHRYVVTTAPNNAEFVVSDGYITVPDTEDFENAGAVTIVAKVADVNNTGQLLFEGNVELKGDLANNPTPHQVILVTNEALTVNGKPLNADEYKSEILEIKVTGPTPEATLPVAKTKKSKF